MSRVEKPLSAHSTEFFSHESGASLSQVADLLGDTEETVARYYKLANRVASERRWHEMLRSYAGGADERIMAAIETAIT